MIINFLDTILPYIAEKFIPKQTKFIPNIRKFIPYLRGDYFEIKHWSAVKSGL